jgi:hypothetical protein
MEDSLQPAFVAAGSLGARANWPAFDVDADMEPFNSPCSRSDNDDDDDDEIDRL